MNKFKLKKMIRSIVEESIGNSKIEELNYLEALGETDEFTSSIITYLEYQIEIAIRDTFSDELQDLDMDNMSDEDWDREEEITETINDTYKNFTNSPKYKRIISNFTDSVEEAVKTLYDEVNNELKNI